MNYYRDGSDYIPGSSNPITLAEFGHMLGLDIDPKEEVKKDIDPKDIDPKCTTATESCFWNCSVKNDCSLYNAAFPHRIKR